MTSPAPAGPRTVAVVTLGCARNEVDSEEMAGRLAAAGWRLVDDPGDADVAVVNTCGFIDQAKKDSIDVLLEEVDRREDPASRTRAVVAVGCLAERYGENLAASLPEADAVLGFDSYADLSEHLTAVLDGRPPAPHVPRDRRSLLPLAPARRVGAPARDTRPPGGLQVVRHRLESRPWAPLKLASGCDRRCAFCAIPAFRGSFVSRPPEEVLAEARWLAEQGVVEVLLVSENSTSYGKDLGDLRLLESLLPRLAAVDGLEWVRVAYLQPAEVRPGLLEVLASTPGVVPYVDLSFQHASPPVLRRMRRFGGTEPFLELLTRVRRLCPTAGVRSNVIVGFPGETQEDVRELESFLTQARLDAVGVFAYSDEEGTEAADLDGKVDEDEIRERQERVGSLVEELMAQRAEDRLGERVTVLVEECDDVTGVAEGRAAHQGPETDGTTRVVFAPASAAGPVGAPPRGAPPRVGALLEAVVVDSEGADLVAEPVTGVDLTAADRDGVLASPGGPR